MQNPAPQTASKDRPAISQRSSCYRHIAKFTKESLAVKLVIFISIIAAASEYINSFETVDEKIRAGLLALNVIGLFLAFVALPEIKLGPWAIQLFFKIVQSAVFVYFVNLVFVIMFDSEMTRYWLSAIDPELSFPLAEHDYAADCRVYTPENPDSRFANIKDNVDMFVSAHLFGWLVKSLIFRNNALCWTMSIGFEFYEMAFRHWLPNFTECWWDTWVLDVFGCNLAGILLGNYIQTKFNMEKFHWFFDPLDDTKDQPAWKRLWFALTNTEAYTTRGKWNFLASPSKFLTVLFAVWQCSLVDLSYFFNKAQLDIPSTHTILALRTIPIGFYSIVVIFQLYHHARDTAPDKRVPFDLALAQFIQIAELILFAKNFKPEFYAASSPSFFKALWMLLGAVLFAGFSYSCYNHKKTAAKKF